MKESPREYRYELGFEIFLMKFYVSDGVTATDWESLRPPSSPPGVLRPSRPRALLPAFCVAGEIRHALPGHEDKELLPSQKRGSMLSKIQWGEFSWRRIQEMSGWDSVPRSCHSSTIDHPGKASKA